MEGRDGAGQGRGMRISDFSIEQPMVTVVAMLALVLFGLFALLALHTDEFPDIEQPVIVVGIPYPGASPEGVEREILERVEESITGIAGIHELRSSASDGYAQLIVFFEFGKNMLEAGQEIRDRISAVRDRLPDEMKEPVLTRVDPADIPVVSLTLASQRLTPVELTRLADPGIVRELRQVPGVAQVDVAAEFGAQGVGIPLHGVGISTGIELRVFVAGDQQRDIEQGQVVVAAAREAVPVRECVAGHAPNVGLPRRRIKGSWPSAS